MRRSAALLLATCAFLAPATSAHAGTYQVVSCTAPGAGNANRSWTSETNSSALRVSERCNGGTDDGDIYSTFTPAMAVRTELGQPYVPLGTAGYWRIDVPAPLKLVGDSLSGHLHSESDSWRLVIETNNGELAHCQSNEPGSGVSDYCDMGRRGGSDYAPQPTALTPSSWYRVGFRCVLNPCHMGSTAHAAAAAVFGAVMVVDDPVPPTAQVQSVGNAAAGQQAAVSISGSDQTGLRRLELLVDGQVSAASDFACDATLVLPCRSPGGPVAAQLATSPLSPGTHSIAARATDAGGNTSTSSAVSLVVATPPTPTPIPTPAATPVVTPAATPIATPAATPPVSPGQTPGASPAPTGGPTPTPTTRSAQLKVKSVKRERRGTRVRVRGQVAAGCRSRVQIRVTVAGRSRTKIITASKSGRWGTTITGLRRTGTIRVAATAKAANGCRTATAAVRR